MKDKLIDIISKALMDIGYESNVEILIETPKENVNGDFSTNIALKLSKELKRNPLDLATEISKNIKADFIKKVEIKSPGFINIFVNKTYLLEIINKIIKEKENYGKTDIGKKEKINIEYVSANPTGVLHLGNARGGAYGDNMARILTFVNYDVNREYYVNDAGNQVDNVGKSLQIRYLELCGIKKEMPEDGYFGKDIILLAEILYKDNKDNLIKENTEFFKTYAISHLLDKIIADLKEYRVIYNNFTSEKEIRSKNYIKDILTYYKENNYTYEKDGAIWFDGAKENGTRDFVLVKNDGNYTYILPDIAHHIDTISRGYTKLINILGADHHGYVPMITTSLKSLGYSESILNIKLLQLVRLIKDGKECKMSKRTGNAVTLKELIDEVGVNATRYFFASRSLDTQMDFNIDIAIKQNNENPIYYISYAYARICSVLRDKNIAKEIDSYKNLNNDDVYVILEKLDNFEKIVVNAALKEMPHLIANYVYELASLFHSYYSKHKIIVEQEDITAENINLIRAIKIVLENSLYLIGIIPPERM